MLQVVFQGSVQGKKKQRPSLLILALVGLVLSLTLKVEIGTCKPVGFMSIILAFGYESDYFPRFPWPEGVGRIRREQRGPMVWVSKAFVHFAHP